MAKRRLAVVALCLVPFAVLWSAGLRSFWRFCYPPNYGLADLFDEEGYLPLLAAFATIAMFFLYRWLGLQQTIEITPAFSNHKYRTAKRTGIVLVFAGTIAVGGWWAWVETRTFIPLDMPISLAVGHIRSREFNVNIPSDYRVVIEADRKFEVDQSACLLGFRQDKCVNNPPLVRVAWSLSEAGKILAESGSEFDQLIESDSDTLYRGIGHFSASDERHLRIDLNVLTDGESLNSTKLRLRIYEQGGVYREYRSATLFIVPVTGLFVLLGLSLWIRSHPQANPRVVSKEFSQDPNKLRVRSRLLFLAGTILLVAGVATLIGIDRWMSSRIFTPVDMPISLARGHTKVGPFVVNLESRFYVNIDTGWYFDPKCPSSQLQNRFTFYRDGQAIPQTLGGFDGKKGSYEIDMEVLSDTACLGHANPRLLVYANKHDYERSLLPILLALDLCVVVGLVLIVMGYLKYPAESRLDNSRITNSNSVGQNFQWAQKLPLRQRFSMMPAFALVMAPFLLLLLVVFWMFGPVPSKGLVVDLIKRSPIAKADDSLNQPVVVQILDAGHGVPPTVQVNSKITSLDKLESTLKNELKVQPQWVVYVTGDQNLAWADALTAIDIAKGLHAKVVLLTTPPRRDPRPGAATDPH